MKSLLRYYEILTNVRVLVLDPTAVDGIGWLSFRVQVYLSSTLLPNGCSGNSLHENLAVPPTLTLIDGGVIIVWNRQWSLTISSPVSELLWYLLLPCTGMNQHNLIAHLSSREEKLFITIVYSIFVLYFNELHFF